MNKQVSMYHLMDFESTFEFHASDISCQLRCSERDMCPQCPCLEMMTASEFMESKRTQLKLLSYHYYVHAEHNKGREAASIVFFLTR